MRKFRLYLDEVGNPDLEHSDDPNHRFLSLTGVICELSYVQERIHPEMEALKKKHFGSHPDEPIILHRSEIVNRKHPFASLRDPEKEETFSAEILHLLREWEYLVITVCIDKKKHRRRTRLGVMIPITIVSRYSSSVSPSGSTGWASKGMSWQNRVVGKRTSV